MYTVLVSSRICTQCWSQLTVCMCMVSSRVCTQCWSHQGYVHSVGLIKGMYTVLVSINSMHVHGLIKDMYTVLASSRICTQCWPHQGYVHSVGLIKGMYTVLVSINIIYFVSIPRLTLTRSFSTLSAKLPSPTSH